jgi:hypothetical protein
MGAEAMTLDTYTVAIFAAGVLTGIALLLLADSAYQQVQIIRYLRRKRAAGAGRS